MRMIIDSLFVNRQGAAWRVSMSEVGVGGMIGVDDHLVVLLALSPSMRSTNKQRTSGEGNPSIATHAEQCNQVEIRLCIVRIVCFVSYE